ncbi:MAG: PTS sugar transporter subunit IIB [Olsenella sp.]|jgi:PTS system cellobiose-specific IIB component|nr:PTS sugar transporter subunit IIB [Olsenella sp.]
MSHVDVLLVCGSGASSGFMAVNMRKAAKKHNVDATITARSEAEIDSYIDSIDALMIGPHLKYLADELKEKYADKPVKIILMDPSYYSTLNGEKALKHLITVLREG